MTVKEILKAWKKEAKDLGIMDKEVEIGIRETGVLFFINGHESIKLVLKGGDDIYKREVIDTEIRVNML